ncbi:MAG: cytochrome c [Candidatus Binatus sp.]|jgi:cytochrome c oxidase cbb3-type subunit 3
MKGRREDMTESLTTKVRSRVWIWTATVIPAVAALALISTAARAADLTSAASSYTDTCAKCHGPAGKGDGPKAAELKDKDGKPVAIGDLSDCAKMSKVTDDDLFKELKEGGASVGKSKFMTPYGDAMEDDEIKAMVAYVRTLCKK